MSRPPSKLDRKLHARRRAKQGMVQSHEIDVRRISAALIKTLVATNPEEKQFWAETALRLLCMDEWVDQAKEQFNWPDGVQPDLPSAEAQSAQGNDG